MPKRLFLLSLLASGLACAADPAPAPATPPAAAPASASDDLSAYKTADALWDHILSQIKGLSEKLRQRDLSAKNDIPQIWASARGFVTQYPQDPRAWDARMKIAQLGGLAMRLKMDIAPTQAALEKQFTDIATATDAPQNLRAEASAFMISQSLQLASSGKGDVAANWDAADAKIEKFQKDFGPTFSFNGKGPVIVLLRTQQLEALKQSSDSARYQVLLEKLITDSQPEVVALAKQRLEQATRISELKTKPVDIKFTAVDGTVVDLSKMRGKVVLVDFWATWCGPCVQEVPHVVETYKKLHAKGFEIVGISLDQNLDALQLFTKAKGMTWPQFFDGKGWDNQISRNFGITSIPAMWLIDKKGMLVNADARDNLAADVEKLLKAP